MSLLAAKATFTTNLQNLWDNPTSTTTIYETGSIIESFWANARVAGYEITPCVPIAGSTSAALSVLATPAGTAATAAAAFEAACLNMVITTLFPIVAPPFTTPPPFPLPGGPALPGILTASLTAFFTALSPESNAAAFSELIAAYLQGFVILVTIPPAAAVSVPII